MFSAYVRGLSLLLWLAIIAIITSGVCRGIFIVLRNGNSGTAAARKTVGTSIVSGLGLTTAIALLATTQLRSWNSIAIFAAAAALRTFTKFAETHIVLDKNR